MSCLAKELENYDYRKIFLRKNWDLDASCRKTIFLMLKEEKET